MSFGKHYETAKAHAEAVEAALARGEDPPPPPWVKQPAEKVEAAPLEPPTPVEAPAVPAIEALLTQLVEKLTAAAAANALTPTQLKQIITEAGQTNAEAMRASLKPENPDHAHISVFFTEADRERYGDWTHKPELLHKTFFCGAEEKEDRLTPAEIEAYNALVATTTAAKFQRVTARRGKWTAELRRNGQHQELHVTVPCETVDQRMDMAPSLLLTLLELDGKAFTEDIGALVRQVAHLKQKLVNTGVDPTVLDQEMLGV